MSVILKNWRLVYVQELFVHQHAWCEGKEDGVLPTDCLALEAPLNGVSARLDLGHVPIVWQKAAGRCTAVRFVCTSHWSAPELAAEPEELVHAQVLCAMAIRAPDCRDELLGLVV
jgi:hypothetical protein